MKSVLYFFVAILFKVSFLYAQSSDSLLQIRIVDARHHEPLPFATVLINKDRHQGLVSNLNGYAKIPLTKKVSCLQISYVGYYTQVISIEGLSGEVVMQPVDVDIEEVVIFPEENPAHRIIKRTVANRNKNNPDKIDEYGCRVYNKSIYDYTFSEEALQDSMLQDFSSFFQNSHAVLMESSTERYHKAPDKTFEKINKVRVSGFKNPSIAPLSTDVQPFHFYEPLISILDVSYLNPISRGSHRKYLFLIEDTLYNAPDTTFIISFRPRRNTNFEGLKGFLHVNTHGYAIENVVAEPAGDKLMDVHIQQNYVLTGNHWFPRELKSELAWNDLYNQGWGMRVKSESYVTHFRTALPKDSINYSEEVLVFDRLASSDAEAILSKHRVVDLSPVDQHTYTQMDSFGEKYKFDYWLSLVEKLSEGKIPVGKFYFPLDKLYTYNEFEGSRMGFGLYTDDDLVRWLDVGGWGAYGFVDEEWKYGGHLRILPEEKKEQVFTAAYQYNALFPGNEDFAREPSYIEGYFLQQADYASQWELAIDTWLKYWQFHFSLTHDAREPQYEYAFWQDDHWTESFEVTEVSVRMRYAYREKYIWQLKQKIRIESKWPVITLEYKKGLKDVSKGEFAFDKLWAQLDYTHEFPRWGESSLRLEAGKIWGKVPYSFLFAGAGGWSSTMPFFVQNRFNTMSPNAYANNEIFNAYFSHDFGTRLFTTTRWKPKVMLTQAFGLGRLTNTHLHRDKRLQDMNKGYYESGLVLNDLVRFNLFNLFYFGVGAGAFYQYGHYASTHWQDNLKFKINGNISF